MKFIKLFSPNGEELQPVMNYYDLTFTYGIDELNTIEFKISGYEDVAALIECEGYLETENDRFVIKEVSEETNFTKTIYGIQDVEELKGALVRHFTTSKLTAFQALQAALNAPFSVNGGLPQTGEWRVRAIDNITRKRSLDLSFTTVWDIIQKIKEVYHVELIFDPKLKRIDLYTYNSIGKTISNQGNEKLIFYDDINVSEFDLQIDSQEFATIIYGYGRKTDTTKKTFEYVATKSENGKTYYYSDKDKKHLVGYKDTATSPYDSSIICTHFHDSVDGNAYYATTHEEGETVIQRKITVNSKSKKIIITKYETYTIGIKDASAEARAEADRQFEDIDFTKNCVYDYTYSTKKIRKYLFDEAYDDPDQILEDCCYWLRELHQPHKSFNLQLVDFSKITDDYRNIGIGDTITVKSRSKNHSIAYRVVSMTVIDDKPEETEVVLASRKKTLADSQAIQKRFLTDNVNSSGAIKTVGKGAVTSSTLGIGAITSDNFISIDASDLVGVIDGNTLDIQNVLADNITSGKIDAQVIDVVNLSADNITSGTLDANKANIVNLDASAISTESLAAAVVEAGALTADSIKTIELDASQITSGELDATNITIKNINGHNIADGTIVAEALAQEVITQLGGVKIFYQPEAPDIIEQKVNEGDIWYQTLVKKVEVSQ